MSSDQKSVGVFTADRDLVVRTWDAWLASVTGIPESQACGCTLTELFPGIDERGLIPRLRRVADEGFVEVLSPAFHQYLIPCEPREPSTHFARMQQHVTISPLRAADAIAGIVITIEDVTGRLERDRELAAQLESQDEAIRLRATMTLAEEGRSESVLAGVLGDESWRVRRAAAEGLGRARGQDVVRMLVDNVRDRHRDPAVLNAALSALAQVEEDATPAVAELLHSADPEVRTYAALALGHLEDPRAVPPLLATLDDGDVNVRYHAIEGLGRLRASAAAEPLAGIAESRDFFLAFAALDALAAIGEPSIASRLVPLLHDPELQAATATTLGTIGSEETIGPLVEQLASASPPLAAAIAGALATLFARLEVEYGEGELVADLARSAMSPEAGHRVLAALPSASDAELRGIVLVLSWLELDGVDAALARLLEHEGVRRTVAEVLARRGSRAVEVLIPALRSDDLETRTAAAMVLGRTGSARGVPGLIAMLRDEPRAAVIAAGALGAIGDPSAFEPLTELLDHPEAAVRQGAIAAISSLAHPRLPSRVRTLLGDASPRVREAAVRIAGYFGYAECLESLLALCGDDDEPVRRAVVEHLGHFDDPRATAAMIDALERGTPGVRAAAARGLGLVDSAPAHAALRGACGDHDPWVRYHAARSLGRARDRSSVETLATLVRRDPLPPVRIASLAALAEIGDPSVLDVAGPLVRDDDDEIACAAIDALGRRRDPTALPLLVEALGARSARRLLAALSSIAALGSGSAAAASATLEELASASGDPQVVRAAVEVLGTAGTQASVAALVRLAALPRTRSAAIATLAHGTEREVAWIGGALAHADEGVRCAIVEAFARMRHRSASVFLATALEDPASSVRLAAAQALGRKDLRGSERKLRLLSRTDESPAVRHAARDALTR